MRAVSQCGAEDQIIGSYDAIMSNDSTFIRKNTRNNVVRNFHVTAIIFFLFINVMRIEI